MSAGRSPGRLVVCGLAALLWLALPAAAWAQSKPQYQYYRVGAAEDIVTKPQAGYALMGGGTDLDEAFRWMCERTHGGDFLILRATGTDAYDPYVKGLEDGKSCKLNSVATLIMPSREAAGDPFVAETIAHAEAIFIAGGDQANYIRLWMGTPVQTAINAAIARGVPLGGTSAGLAVMGEWAYSAEGDKPDDPNLDSKTALMNPLSPRITLVHGFLNIPILKDIITDSHFVKRDRIGRLSTFMARIESSGDPNIKGLGINEGVAVLVEPDGQSSVVGKGVAYFFEPFPPAPAILPGKPLDQANFFSQKVKSGSEFNLSKWCCGLGPDDLIVEHGTIRWFQDHNPIE
jgi:cyanophycinase